MPLTCLLLTACPVCTVHPFAETFSGHEWLWKNDLQAEYAAFVASAPTLEDCEGQLKRMNAAEQVGLQALRQGQLSGKRGLVEKQCKDVNTVPWCGWAAS